MKQPEHLARHPFGQIPTYEDGDLVLFESGAIVLHIAERHAGLLPGDASARMRAIAWMFAAVNTVEPPLIDVEIVKLHERDQPWSEARLPIVEARAHKVLGELSRRLGEAEWLDGGFSAGDLMMAAVLFRKKAAGLLDGFPNLAAYVAQSEARPAFQRAFAGQLAVFEGLAGR